jgi:arylsulfatase A-like enzyme
MRAASIRSFLLLGGTVCGLGFLWAGLWMMITHGVFGPAVHAFFDPPPVAALPADNRVAKSKTEDNAEAQRQRLAPWQAHPAVEGSTSPDILVVTICSFRADRTAAGLHDPRSWTENPLRTPLAASQTPAFDALARRSVSLTGAWANAPFTAPSHAALLTGLLPDHSGVVDLGDAIPVDVPTLPEVLALYGYRTYAYVPVETLGAAEPHRGESCRAVSGNRGGDSATGRHAAATFHRGNGFERGFHQFLEGNATTCDATLVDALAGDPRPFFALVHLKEAHMPYGLRSAAAGTIDPRLVAWARGDLPGSRVEHKDRKLLAEIAEDPALGAALTAAYDGAVGRADAHLGSLLQAIEARGRLRDTLVVVLGDHGESLGDNGDLGHQGSMQPEVLHVPVVVHLPGDTQAGRVEPGALSLVDLPLTLLAAAGALPPARTDGHNLLAALRGAAPWPDHPALAQGRLLQPGQGRRPVDLFIHGDRALRVSAAAGDPPRLLRLGPLGWATTTELVPAELQGAYAALAGTARPSSAARPFSPAEQEQLRRQGYW